MRNKCLFLLILVLLVCLFPGFSFAETEESEEELTQSDTTIQSVTLLDSSDLRITASSTTGLQSLVLSLIGDYEPIVKDYTYTTTSYNGQVTINHSIEIQPDYSWIASACIFAIVIFCTFRFLGGLFKG